jgi:zinc protease
MPRHRFILPSGLTVLYREDPSLPLTAATLLMKGGMSVERPSEAGLCNLTVELLFQGTKHRKAAQVSKELEAMGAFLGSQVAEDYSEIGIIVPASSLPRALNIMVEALVSPAFPDEELGKERSHTLASLHSRYDTIFHVAHDRFLKELYGSHPYGRLVEGTPEALRRFRRSDLKRWHREHIRPENAIFSMVGPLPWRQAERLLERTFGTWAPPAIETEPLPVLAIPSKSSRRRVEVSARFEQAYVMQGVLAPMAHDSSAMTLKVLNTVLGGGMSSRLFVQLREDRGLAYEVSSFFPTRLRPSHWVVYLGCAPERRKEAERALNQLLAHTAQRGVSDAEIRQAKEMMKGSFAMDYQTRRRQAWYAAWWEFLGLGGEYATRFPKIVDNVSRAEVNRLARQLLSMPRLTVEVAP